jgi:hypothetical protein
VGRVAPSVPEGPTHLSILDNEMDDSWNQSKGGNESCDFSIARDRHDRTRLEKFLGRQDG